MATVPILFLDDHLVVVDKPAGCVVVPAPGRRGPTVVERVTAQLGRHAQAVHRLDEDTTGVLVLALDEPARTGLEALFRAHRVEREYLALASAAPSPPAGRIEARLQQDDGGVMRVVTRGGERAVTHYETLDRRGRCSLLRCRLETGRRNQIRAHLAALGCPLAGDRKYGFRSRPGEHFARVMLHSWRLRFEHPLTRRAVDVAVAPAEPVLRP
ncbi:MAG: RluA family pseudouridine synthase [Planctomycetes bacterium]|nr:RluA family pseudouridine synthase [Planctomycetota bacterium]